MELDNSYALAGIALVVLASGCVSGGSDRSLDPRLDVNATGEVNRTGSQILDQSLSQARNTEEYNSSFEGRMISDFVVSLSINSSSSAQVSSERTRVEQTASISLGGNATEAERTVVSDENGTRVVAGEEPSEAEGGNLSASGGLESLSRIDFSDATVEGTSETGHIVLETEAPTGDLWSYYDTFSVREESEQESYRSGDSSESQSQSSSYLWVDPQTYSPSKFAFYGSEGNGTMEFRGQTEFTYGDSAAPNVSTEAE